jgi:hypothetical protein
MRNRQGQGTSSRLLPLAMALAFVGCVVVGVLLVQSALTPEETPRREIVPAIEGQVVPLAVPRGVEVPSSPDNDRLKVICVAMRSYLEIGRKVPESRIAFLNRPSWITKILPYLDRLQFPRPYHGLETSGEDIVWDAPENRQMAQSIIYSLISETLRSLELFRDASGYALTGFVGVGDPDEERLLSSGNARSSQREFFFGGQCARLSDVTDGLSQTAVVMEARSEFGAWARNGPSTIRPIDRFEGGFMLMVDGSVRSYAKPPAPRVLRALGTIAAGD